MNIAILGGTGYTGSNLVTETVKRGHHVTAVSRTAPAADKRVEEVDYVTGSLLDPEVQKQVVDGADVVLASLFPQGEMAGRLPGLYSDLARLASEHGARFGAVGGFSSLRRTEGAPRIAEVEKLPAEYAAFEAIATEMMVVLQNLETLSAGVDWFYVSPAEKYGSWAPGEARGTFRVGEDVAFFDADGVSAIGGADFATAIVDEIERPQHRRAVMSVAY